MANTISWVVKQGEDFTRIITWKSGSPATPIDLTGATAVCKFRITPESPGIVATPTIILGGTAGTITLNMTDTVTTNIKMQGAKTGTLTEGTETVTGLLGTFDIIVTIGTTSTVVCYGQFCFKISNSR